MAATLVEQTRLLHEDNERLERVVAKDLQQPDVKTHRDRLMQSHRVRNCVDQIVANSARLAQIYEDTDHARRDEISALAGHSSASQNPFGAFYERLNEIRDYHRRHPGARAVEQPPNTDELIKEEPWVEFSGEEMVGKNVDLHELHNVFVNSRFGKPDTDYAAYLHTLQEVHRIPRNHKFTKPYREYIANLLAYLTSFFQRTQPLQDLNKVFAKVETNFEERWKEGQVLGWEDRGNPALAAASRSGGSGAVGSSSNGDGPRLAQQQIVDLDEFDTVEELLDPELVAPEKIKQALSALGLKTGGTPRERAQRLLLTKSTPLEELHPKHFAKGVIPPKKKQQQQKASTKQGKSKGAAPNGTNSGSSSGNGSDAASVAKQVALTEAKVQRLCELLQEPIAATKAHVERKAALTTEEIEAEREEVEAAAVEAEDSDEDDDDGPIYNPLKLPLGWDGKPIPYWLYKLHGLNLEFKCEICGNYSYWGRRAFERHFKEFRHQHGMRCLGIPNTKSFHEITSIKDAQELWEKIRERQGGVKFRPDFEEECEDREGNVYDKRTYQDLQRQGLL